MLGQDGYSGYWLDNHTTQRLCICKAPVICFRTDDAGAACKAQPRQLIDNGLILPGGNNGNVYPLVGVAVVCAVLVYYNLKLCDPLSVGIDSTGAAPGAKRTGHINGLLAIDRYNDSIFHFWSLHGLDYGGFLFPFGTSLLYMISYKKSSSFYTISHNLFAMWFDFRCVLYADKFQ
jgi:hypothetical protein